MCREPRVRAASDGHAVRERWFWIALPVAAVLVAGVVYQLVPGTNTAPELPSVPTAVSDPQPVETPETVVELTARYEEQSDLNDAWVRELPEPVDLSPGVDCATAGRETHDHGAVDRGSSRMVLTVRARRPTTLLLLSLRAEIIERAPVGTGPLMLCVPGPEPDVLFQPPPAAHNDLVIDGDTSEEREVEFQGQAVEYEFGEVVQTPVDVFARACDCRWRLEVEAVVDGMRHRWHLHDADRGKPFRTSAPPARSALEAAQVWCAPQGSGRLTTVAAGDCPSPLR